LAAAHSGATLGVAMVMGVVGLVLCALPPILGWQRTRFAEGLAAHAEAATGGVARLEVRRLAQRGLDALPALVRLAGSPNADAGDAARDAVENSLAGWEVEARTRGHWGTLSYRLRLLTGALAACADDYDHDSRAWARRIALQAAGPCDRLPPREAMVILANCDRVLALRPLPKAPAATASSAPIGVGPAANRAPAGPPPPRPAAPPAPMTAVASRPTASPPPAAAPAAGGELAIIAPPSEPIGIVAPVEPMAPWAAAQGGAGLAAAPDAPAPVAPAVEGVRPLPLPPPERDPALVNMPRPAQQRSMLRRYRVLSDRELAAALTTAAPDEAALIAQVQRERQSPPTARGPGRASSPPRTTPPTPGSPSGDEPRLVDRLRRLPAAQARQMLRQLAADATGDAQTRWEALSLLATSGDPELTAIARQRALEDSDPQVAELAMRILRGDQQRTSSR
jgi:hypothetical protein